MQRNVAHRSTSHRRQFLNWRIHIGTRSDKPTPFKLAVGFDDTLDIVEDVTPFDYTFDAYQFTALMALCDEREIIAAELWSNASGDFQKTGSFGGAPRGKFTHHHSGPCFGSAGSSF